MKQGGRASAVVGAVQLATNATFRDVLKVQIPSATTATLHSLIAESYLPKSLHNCFLSTFITAM